MVLQTLFRGASGSSGDIVLDINVFSCWSNMTAISAGGTAICHGDRV